MNQNFLITTMQRYMQGFVYCVSILLLCNLMTIVGQEVEVPSSDVQQLLNQADASFNQARNVQALAYYMRAKKYAPYGTWSCIDKNIENIYKKIGVQPQKGIHDKFAELLLKTTSFFSLSFFKVIFLFFWYILFVLIVCTRLRRRFFIVLISTVLLLFVAVFGFRWYVYNVPYALVQESILKAGPGDYYHTLGTVHTAETVLIEQQKDDFYLIKNKAVKGWLKKEDVYIF